MGRHEILKQISDKFGFVPDYLNDMPDEQLQHQWPLLDWFLGDSALSARDKALVGLGAATALHCPY